MFKDDTNPLRKFNKCLKLFFKELAKSYPQYSEFKFMLAGYKLLKAINKKTPQEWFDITIDPYKAAIIKRDDTFFINQDFNIPDSYSMMCKAMVPTLIEIWKQADDVNRKAVWDHLCVLIHLSEQCKVNKSS